MLAECQVLGGLRPVLRDARAPARRRQHPSPLRATETSMCHALPGDATSGVSFSAALRPLRSLRLPYHRCHLTNVVTNSRDHLQRYEVPNFRSEPFLVSNPASSEVQLYAQHDP